MARRRNTNEMEDEVRLVESEETLETTSSSTSPPSSTKIMLSDVEDSEPGPQVEEESHHVPFPLSFKQRLRHVSQSSRNRQACRYTTIGILGVMCILAVSVPLGIWSGENKQECHDFEDVAEEDYDPFPYLFWPGSGEFVLCEKGDLRLTGTLGIYHDHLGTPKVDLYDYTHGTRLNLTKINTNCIRVEWDGTSSIDAPLRDCYDMGDSYWYVGYELYNQQWPLSSNNHDMMPFYPGDYLFSNDVFGPVVHPLWLNSNGTGIIVDEGVQLYVSIQDRTLCLQALPFELECIPHSSNQTFFHYTVCTFDTIAETAKYFLNQSSSIKHPTGSPDIAVFRDPIWSTWAEYEKNIDASTLEQFVADIRSHDFSISQLEIDDGYSANYGELSFNHAKFNESNVCALSNDVPLTAWVHPFVNPSAVDEFNFSTGLNDSFFLPGYSNITQGHSTSLVKWWNGFGGVIDFLNNSISSRHQDRLNRFMIKYNLTSFKFDAGEVTYLPKCVYIEGLTHPAEFTAAYARFVANQSYASRAEVRIGYFTQDLPILVRMLDKSSKWGTDNGLKSVLTTALTFGIAGYPFILPDMIGGNGYTSNPDPELYVRWAQLTAFLPTMQFSIPPWRFDDNVVTCVRKMVQLHNELSTIMYNLSSDATLHGFPIVRPLWWILKGTDDEDMELWTIDDQFLIGNDIMVAPVLDQGVTSRSVYFPNTGATWITELPERLKNEQHKGRTHKIFKNITLCDTFYFRRM